MIEIEEENDQRYNIKRENKSIGYLHFSTTYNKWYVDMHSKTEIDIEEAEVIAKQIEEINGKV